MEYICSLYGRIQKNKKRVREKKINMRVQKQSYRLRLTQINIRKNKLKRLKCKTWSHL